MTQSDLPEIAFRESSGVSFFTDDSLFDRTGTRIAFTTRHGGGSGGGCEGLNLGTHVGDDLDRVQANKGLLLDALDLPKSAPLICPNQVHGSNVVTLDSGEPDCMEATIEAARAGADAIVIKCAGAGALLCYADCLPLILVAPNGEAAVVHAGWRGAVAHIASKALLALCESAGCRPGDVNAYIGPYIHEECFEVGSDVAKTFESSFPESAERICATEGRVNLGEAVKTDLFASGASLARIADIDKCTFCNNDDFYSYRAQNGDCGRHGALAFRR